MRRAASILAGAAAVVGLAALGGCGFTPLYARPGVAGGITHIEVIAPKGREGYLLRQNLDDDFGHAQGEAPVYRLEVTMNTVRQAHGLTANDTAQRYELDLKVSYNLIEVASGKVAHAGAVVSDISYDSTDQPYAGIAARQDVQNRLASDVAQKIEIQVASWLASQPAG
jgi:LPS-assembly lipoprotein